jgi:subtilisin family serine protease
MDYRGVLKSATDIDSTNKRWAFGLAPLQANGRYITNLRVSSVDVDVQEMIDEGIHVCIAAGNHYHKIDRAGGDDYNNSALTNTGRIYYHQGSSPYSSNAIMVGSLDSESFDITRDKKADYSNSGEGIDIFAAGTDIMSCCSNINTKSAVAYHLNSNFKQVNIYGTSMASPQVAGVASLYLQNNPTATPAQVKTWLLSNASSTVFKTSVNNDYTELSSQWGGDVRVLYNPPNTIDFYKGDSGKMTNLTMKRT